MPAFYKEQRRAGMTLKSVGRAGVALLVRFFHIILAILRNERPMTDDEKVPAKFPHA
jgi:hypothetical protein